MADEDPRTITLRRSTVVRVGIAAAILAALGLGLAIGLSVNSPSSSPAKSAGSSTTTTAAHVATTTTIAPTTTTAAAPTTTTAPPVPLVMVCTGTPMYKPTTMNWCTSLCSDSIQGVTWSSWTATSASGTGTLITNDGLPNCAQGTLTAHSGYTVTLSSPQTVPYCSNTGQASALLYTSTNLWSNATIPAITPPCP